MDDDLAGRPARFLVGLLCGRDRVSEPCEGATASEVVEKPQWQLTVAPLTRTLKASNLREIDWAF
jgi:hypothetical protein